MALEPLIPEFVASPKGGRRGSVDDRAALSGILYVLHTGIPWEDLPQELGFGSGMTCWRRLRDWQADGVWDKLHRAMLVRLRETTKLIGVGPASTGQACPAPGGDTNRAEPDGSRQAREQAAPRSRCPRRSPGHHRNRGEST
uniref:Insertion element IS402-like domain-containing protein n=1 Tax=Ralstonia solanacearum CFBP2957 TaxID=859656 RepID=D8P3E3_RALSL|nr:protein of unknown function [Ralstonia solanacearum CFBP2957]